MNNSDNNQIEDTWESQLIEYSMGVLEPAAALEFEQSLNECKAHVKLADNYSQIIGWVGASASIAEPPTGHKNRMMSRIATTPQEVAQGTVRTRTAPTPLMAVPAATDSRPTPINTAAYAPLSAAPADRVQTASATGAKTPAEVTDLAAYRERRGISRNVAALGALAAAFVLVLGAVWMYTFLSKPYIPANYQAVAAQAQPGGASGSAVLFWNPNTQDAFLLANGLQQLPQDKVYELWLLPKSAQGGGPIPAGTFNAAQAGDARHTVSAPGNMSDYAGVALTVEPAPGQNAPTTKPFIVITYTQ